MSSSTSLRAAAAANAVGTLKQELAWCGSLIVRLANENRVPAGGALAVQRDAFARSVTDAIASHPRIAVVRQHCDSVPSDRPCVIATGPLTSDELAADLSQRIGLAALQYYDAIAPILSADSIDWSVVFRQSRYDRSDKGDEADARAYVNCPFDREQYESFVSALRQASQQPGAHGCGALAGIDHWPTRASLTSSCLANRRDGDGSVGGGGCPARA